MYSLLVILAVIVAVLLILIVLIQESKGGGLASNFSASNQIMGVRKTTDVIEKATWTLAGVLVVLAVATIFFAPRQTDAINSVVTGAAPAASTAAPTKSAPAAAKTADAPAAQTPATPAK